MELTQLKFFLEVAKSQHVTKSAETLHVSQPSLTQSLHKLEDELEVPLFLHKGRNVYLSEYGKILYERLLPVMTELDNIPYELKKQAKLGNETIRINVLAVSALVTEAIIKYPNTGKDKAKRKRIAKKFFPARRKFILPCRKWKNTRIKPTYL